MNQSFNRDAVALLNASLPTDALQSAYEQLKPTQRQFVDNYIATDNPTEAYLRIHEYLRAPELKSRVYPRVFELMKMPLVQAAIRERQKELSDRIQITAENVTQEIAKVGFANLQNYMKITSDGEPYFDLSELTPAQWAAIGELTVEDFIDGRGKDARDVKRVKLKLHSKIDALEKLAKVLGLYAPDKLEVTGKDGAPLRHDVRQVTMAMTPEQAAEQYARSLEED